MPPVLQGRTFDFGMAQARGAAIPAAVGSGILCGIAPRTGAPWDPVDSILLQVVCGAQEGSGGLWRTSIGLVLADHGSGIRVVVLGAGTGCWWGLQAAAWLCRLQHGCAGCSMAVHAALHLRAPVHLLKDRQAMLGVVNN